MKNLNFQFILSNIITAVILFFSVPYYREKMEHLTSRGSSPEYGIFILIASGIGIISMVIKSHDLTYRSKNSIRWHGRLFLLLTYLGAFSSNIFIVREGERLANVLRSGGGFLLFLLLLLGFFLLAMEAHLMQNRPKQKLPSLLVKIADQGSMIYSSIGINLCWNHFVVGSHINMGNPLQALPIYILLMFLFVFSFQRLFWYEVMTDSETKLDNVKTFLAILLVFVSGILPIYLN